MSEIFRIYTEQFLRSNFDTLLFNSIEKKTSSVQYFTSKSTPSKRYLHPIKSSEITLGNFVRIPPKKVERPLLRMIISNGQWVDNQATLGLFELLNPYLVLPDERFYQIVY